MPSSFTLAPLLYVRQIPIRIELGELTLAILLLFASFASSSKADGSNPIWAASSGGNTGRPS